MATEASSSAQPAAAAAPTVPPLSLSTVRQRYPRLFRQYSHLSERETSTFDDFSDDLAGLPGFGPPPIDPATGLALNINHNDFAEPLQASQCPMATASDGNKFCIFLWKCLSATESGSCGGDACRQFDVLHAALDDALSAPPTASRFEHLLAWTAAAANHGLSMLLYRGDPDRNRALFKAACDEWKKLFERVENDVAGTTGVNKELLSFAEWQCKYFQSLLKQAKEEYGEWAKYTFNFKKQKRAPKGPAPAAAVAASAAATAAASTNVKENSVPAENATDDDDEMKPWEMEGWVPTTKSSGKQKTPNMIRNELQKYIDQCHGWVVM